VSSTSILLILITLACSSIWHKITNYPSFAEFKMKHLAAYLLLSLGGNSSPSEKDVKTVLESVGIEADDDRLKSLISELKGKDLQEVRIHQFS
jgi:hypothetical protein